MNKNQMTNDQLMQLAQVGVEEVIIDDYDAMELEHLKEIELQEAIVANEEKFFSDLDNLIDNYVKSDDEPDAIEVEVII